MTFGGGNHGFTLLGGATTTSDWVNLSGFTSSDKLIVDLGISGSDISYTTGGVVGTYSKASVDDYNVATVPGYSANSGAQVGVTKIEVQ